MSKPNANQLAVLRIIHRHIHYWEKTNDISSPTHIGDFESDLTNLIENGLPTEQAEELRTYLLKLISTIRNIKI